MWRLLTMLFVAVLVFEKPAQGNEAVYRGDLEKMSTCLATYNFFGIMAKTSMATLVGTGLMTEQNSAILSAMIRETGFTGSLVQKLRKSAIDKAKEHSITIDQAKILSDETAQRTTEALASAHSVAMATNLRTAGSFVVQLGKEMKSCGQEAEDWLERYSPPPSMD